MTEKVSIIGSGNIAHWMAYAITCQGMKLQQVFSRQMEHAESLAQKYKASAIDDLSQLDSSADLYIFSIKDDSLEDVLKLLPFKLSLAVHTAGALSVSLLKDYAQNYGIVYPCQSMNKGMDFEGVEVPLCVEGNNAETLGKLMEFASRISPLAKAVNEQQRFVLHRAAIFGCNFTNVMYGIAHDLMEEGSVDWQLLIPLLQNTLDKVKTNNPHDVQTGPAHRHDENVVRFHEKALKDDKIKEIYRLLSDYIGQGR